MPKISGSQPALMYSLVGVNRVGASRVGYYSPRLFVQTTQPGVSATYSDVSTTVLKSDLMIEQHRSDTPDTLTLIVRSNVAAAFSAAPGAGIRVGLGSKAHPIFAGRIMKVRQHPRTKNQRFPRWTIEAVDHSWQLNHRRVTTAVAYTGSASTIAASFLATYAPFFTASVEGGLIDVEIATNLSETIGQFLTRLAQMCDAHWFVDPNMRVHFYQTTPPSSNVIDSTTDIWDLDYSDDVSQVRNQVYAIGGGAVTTADWVGSSTPGDLHVENVGSWYDSAGGFVQIDGKLYTYTGFTDGADPILTGFSSALDIPTGAQVKVVSVSSDNASQVRVQNWFNGTGGIGVIDHVLEDSTLDVDGATFRADAELALFADSFTTISFKTRNPNFLTGQQVSVNLASIADFVDVGVGGVGTFLVESVTIHGSVGDRLFPVRTVTLGTFQRNLSELLGRLGRVIGTPAGNTGI